MDDCRPQKPEPYKTKTLTDRENDHAPGPHFFSPTDKSVAQRLDCSAIRPLARPLSGPVHNIPAPLGGSGRQA